MRGVFGGGRLATALDGEGLGDSGAFTLKVLPRAWSTFVRMS